ncbi:PREDICTED: serine protease SP24D-like [Bactrocera latifrons]|uniref:Serine protease SP24D n=1 Tax=Bactrocera latifrons TaxID=174628 RepID=A0A0K8U1G4_BACLA|nr:PREDICTED: serine protease SP24D-like [Bactrocera latifrons]
MAFLQFLAFFAVAFVVVTANPTGRVVGGYDAVSAQFPHQISLRFQHRHNCGGSIIASNYILTAAHCVVETGTTPYDAEHFTIRAGTHNRIAGGVIVQVKRVVVHQGYVVENDLALLELEEHLIFSSKIQAIPLASAEVPSGAEVIISGWGLTENKGDSLPIIMQWNTVTALSKSQCFRKILISSDALLCLDHPSGAGACNGDSGGPATYNGELVGVAGFVVIGCGTSRPDGYAKVFHNLEWIHANMI